MNTKTQIWIDQFIAKPIAFCLNFLVRLTGKIFSIDHRLDIPFQRIVICKFKGLGSIIQATPMLQALRESYPDADITFLSTKSQASFLSKVDVVNKVIAVDDSTSWKLITSLSKAVLQMLRNRPEVYIDLEIYSNFSTLVAISTLAKNRIGFYLRSSSFRTGIYTHMMYYNTNVPISEVYLHVARLMNPKANSYGLYPIFKSIDHLDLPKEIQDDEYIVVNPNASELRIERRWAGDKFKQLTEKILGKYPQKKVVFIGAPSESNYVAEILRNYSHKNLVNLAGKTSFDELIQLIFRAELVITNDTGPMHMAFACNTPTIALFGPCSPDKYGWNANAKIIYKQVYCSPCVHEFVTPPCNGDNTCMQLITVDEVFNEVIDFYKNDSMLKNSSANSLNKIIYTSNFNKVLGVLNP